MRILGQTLPISVIICLSAILLSFSWGEIAQPIRFNHNIHAEIAEMDCSDCHEHFESGEAAGLPSEELCAMCHSEPLGDSVEEKKLVGLLEEGNGLEWQRIFQMPRHVFFSHRRHVVLARLDCEVCHGDMKARTAPLQKRDNKVTMEFCMDCHTVQNVSNDCLDCHR